MAVYNQKNITNLYWAYNEGFKRGRDPMGIQNNSITIYGLLLPGLTNLTGHIRYYSLYCWLIDEYAKEFRISRIQRTKKHQYNYIRRAELVMAFIMAGRNVNSVVGALYVQRNICPKHKNGSYNIKAGADIDNETKYWTWETGAFGQYYLGSLSYLQLVTVKGNSFYVKERGINLAEAFRKSVKPKTRQLFLEVIKNGMLSEHDIEKLEEMRLDRIMIESEEWKFLNDMFVNDDLGGSSSRRESIQLMLDAVNKGITVANFPQYRYLEYDGYSKDASLGWYYYYLCEAIHYSVESLFWMILENADIYNNHSLNEFLEICKKDITENLHMDRALTIGQIVEMSGNRDLASQLDIIIHDVTQKDDSTYKRAAADSVYLLFELYREYQKNKNVIDWFEKENKLSHIYGYVSWYIDNYVNKFFDLKIDKYVAEVIKIVMNNHTTAACRKMGTGQTDLRKFLIEDGRIVSVEIRKPQFTSPRTESLYNYLCDLSYIQNGKVRLIL